MRWRTLRSIALRVERGLHREGSWSCRRSRPRSRPWRSPGTGDRPYRGNSRAVVSSAGDDGTKADLTLALRRSSSRSEARSRSTSARSRSNEASVSTSPRTGTGGTACRNRIASLRRDLASICGGSRPARRHRARMREPGRQRAPRPPGSSDIQNRELLRHWTVPPRTRLLARAGSPDATASAATYQRRTSCVIRLLVRLPTTYAAKIPA